MKKCRDCGEDKELKCFSILRKNPDGHHNQCRQCMSEKRSPNKKPRGRRQYVDDYGESYEDFG